VPGSGVITVRTLSRIEIRMPKPQILLPFPISFPYAHQALKIAKKDPARAPSPRSPVDHFLNVDFFDVVILNQIHHFTSIFMLS